MDQKPGDLFLSVIDFFGILIPGAVLAYLHGDFLLGPLGLSATTPDTLGDWIPAFFIAFILGHFLLGFSVPLNRLCGASAKTVAYYEAVRDQIKLPPGVDQSRENVFYSAFSFVRIHSPAALAEIERQAAR